MIADYEKDRRKVKNAIIVGAAPLGSEVHLLKAIINDKSDKLLIAADGGINFFMENDICPDYFLGDLDSFDENCLIKVKEKFPKVKTGFVSPIKDDTDMELAIKTAINLDYNEIAVFGGLGGERISHTVANIQLINGYYSKGIKISLYGPKIKMFVISDGDKVTYDRRKKGFISVFSLSEKCENVVLKGFAYDYEGELISKKSLGVSNQIEIDNAFVSVDRGDLLVVEEFE